MSGNLLTLTEQDRGREVPVTMGEEVELRLPENPTTGLRWHLEPQAGFEVTDDRNDAPRDLAPGAASDRVFRLRILYGDIHLRLQRGQAWDPGTPPDATFELHLKAH